MFPVAAAAFTFACADEASECMGEFELRADGLCYEVGDANTSPIGVRTYGDFLSAVAPCSAPTPGDGELDLYGGCVGDACLASTIEDWTQVHGEPDCRALDDSDDVNCAWRGFNLVFPDSDRDGEPDSGAAAEFLSIEGLFRGSTAGGLSAGIELGCFVDALGEPDSHYGGSNGTSSISYDELLINAFTFGDDLVFSLTVYGVTEAPSLR